MEALLGIIILGGWLAPILHVVFSSRTSGGAKLGWFILVCAFHLIGWAISMIFTSKKSGANAPLGQ